MLYLSKPLAKFKKIFKDNCKLTIHFFTFTTVGFLPTHTGCDVIQTLYEQVMSQSHYYILFSTFFLLLLKLRLVSELPCIIMFLLLTDSTCTKSMAHPQHGPGTTARRLIHSQGYVNKSSNESLSEMMRLHHMCILF